MTETDLPPQRLPAGRAPWRKTGALAAALLLLAIGAAVLAGLLARVPLLVNFGSPYGMAPNTALAFLLLGAGLLASALGEGRSPGALVAGSCGLAVLLFLGLPTLVQYAFDVDLGIDTLLVSDAQRLVLTRHPARMTVTTATLLSLLGGAMLSLHSRFAAAAVAGMGLTLLALTGAVVSLIGYGYSMEGVQVVGPLAATAPHTIVALLAAAAGLLLLRRHGVFDRITAIASIRGQLVTLVLAVSLPLVALVVVVIHTSAEFAQRQAQATVNALADRLAADTQALLAQAELSLQYVGRNAHLAELEPSRCEAMVTAVAEMNPRFTSVLLLDASGRMLCRVPRVSGDPVSFADREWFVQALGTDDLVVGEPVMGKVAREPGAPLSLRILHEGRVTGVALAGTSLRELNRFVQAATLPDGSVATIFSRRGVVLARSLDAERWLGRDGGALAEAHRQRAGDAPTNARGLDGVERVYASRALTDAGWTVSVGVPGLEAMGPHYVRMGRTVAVVAAVLLATTLLARALARAMADPIVALASASRDATLGLGHFAPEDGPLEVRQAAQSFNRMQQQRAQAEARLASRTHDLEESNKELEAFAYSLSHDLRTPLRAIDGFSMALLEDCGDRLDATGRDHLARVRQAARRIGELIDEMLKLGRATRGELEWRPVDLSAMATEVMQQLRTADPGRRVDAEIQPGVHVMADPGMLRLVVNNLLGNAWKFTGATPGARITLRAANDGQQVTCTIGDNGAGFDMAHAHNLFEPFSRLHRHDEFPGNGIGLATVRRVVARLRGRVWGESVPGEGTSFHFTLPAPGRVP